jgi:hypothetical protein
MPASGAERPRTTHELAENARNYQLTHADTVHARVFDIAQLLQRWDWSFPELVRHWISYNDGARGKRGRHLILPINASPIFAVAG